MKRLLTLVIIVSAACISLRAASVNDIIPAPAHAEELKGSLKVAGISIKCDPSMPADAINAVGRFATTLTIATGKTSSVSSPIGLKESVGSDAVKGIIFLQDSSLAKEAYSISISDSKAVVRVNGLNSTVYAIQTMMQLLPEAVYSGEPAVKEKWNMPCCIIEDHPRFGYRGMHLDCSRHFWQVDEIKRYIDVMVMYKLNSLHWHLTDDQGWRIEISRYPLLTQIGSMRSGTSDGTRYGGSYTQDDVREVLAYAAERGITIIPGISLPDHMTAALAAYPGLGCTGGPYEVMNGWGTSDQILCAGKESTMTFLQDVLDEIAALFPGEYIHLGDGDCPVTEWEKCSHCQALIEELGLRNDGERSAEQQLLTHLRSGIQSFLQERGKKTVGPGEILSPANYLSFDYRQYDDPGVEPGSYDACTTIDKAYSYDPAEDTGNGGQQILGVEAELWTEYIATPEHLEYMLLPRLLALSEVQWCVPEKKDLDRFLNSVKAHQFPVLDKAGYTYSKVILGVHGF